MHGPADSRIYLQPLAMLRGLSASRAVKAGQALWLAGGPLAFTIIKIIFREGGSRQGERLVPVGGLASAIADLSGPGQTEISGLLRRISAVRPALACAGRVVSKWQRPLLQGIVNVTPDSFSDGYDSPDKAISHAHQLIGEGADIIDIGGESTRPGAEKISVRQELDRVLPVIEGLADSAVPLSIDSRNAEVMAEALKAGASIVNDVTALTHDKDSLDIVARADCPVILMHSLGSPDRMQDRPQYDDVVLDIYDYLAGRLEICQNAGIDRDRLIIDPGIGFGKTVAHNMALIRGLGLFHGLGVPLLLGASRKSFIGHLTGEKAAASRLGGSLAAGQAGYDRGVQILRVHDVRQSRQARDMWVASGK